MDSNKVYIKLHFGLCKLDDNYAIFEVELPDAWIGKNIREVNLRQRYGINIMAIKEKGSMKLAISPEDILNEGQTLLVVGEHKAIQNVFTYEMRRFDWEIS